MSAVRSVFARSRAFVLIGLAVAIVFQTGLFAGVAEARRPRMSDIVNPLGLAVDPTTGKTWITSAGNDNCYVFALGRAGIARHVAGNGSCDPSGDGGHARAAGLESPYEVAVSATHVYVAGQTSVRRIERAHGGIGTFVGDPRYRCHLTGYSGPFAEVGRMADEVGISIAGMTLDPVSGNLFFVDDCQDAIVEVDVATGEIVSKWVGEDSATPPTGDIAISAAGEIYFTSGPYQQTVYKITGPRTAVRVAGTGSGGFSGNNGPATRATFDPVTALALDTAGNLYLAAGSVYARVMRVDTRGILTTAIGIGGRGNWGGTPTGRAGDMALRTISALATDPDGNLYIGGWVDSLVAVMEAPFSANSRWSWLMKDRLGITDIERNGGTNPAVNNCDEVCDGDPVNTATGEYWEQSSDMAIVGRGPAIDFVRSYGASNAGVDGPLGYGWSHPYGMSLSVDDDGYVAIRQENGSEIGFEPDGSGGFEAAPGQFATLEQNPDGSYTLVRRQRETFHFASDGTLTAIEDLNGYATTLGYDGSGRLETITDEAGRTVTLSYDGSDRIVGLEDVAGRRVVYGYDSNGDLSSVTDVRGERWTYSYRDHLLLTQTDPNGHLDVRNVYDADGEVLSQENGAGGVLRFEYLPGLTRTTSPAGRVTEYYYAGGQLVKKVEAAGTRQAATWSYEYDPTTRGVTQTVDPRGNRWLATYDAMGLQTSTQTPLGATTATTYDEHGRPLTQTDPMGVTTTMTYDGGGNLLTTSTPVGLDTVTQSYDYDDASYPGDMTRVTDPLGDVTDYAYDRYGNQVSVTDPTGAQSTATYDILGRVQTAVSPRGNEAGNDPADYTTSYAYDAAGNVLSQTDPDGDEQRASFDGAGNKATATDEAGAQTRYTYDDADRLVQTTRPDTTTLLQSYDADGLVSSTTDGAGKRASYTYDAAGRLETVTDPDRRTTTFGHDLAGNLTTALDPAAKTTTNTYDTSNRLTRVAYSDGSTPTVTFRYDNAGRRTSMTDGTGTSSFTYDDLGRLAGHTDGARKAVAYGYDLASRLTTLTYANGRALTRAFDDAGRLTSVTDWLGNATAFEYDADDHLTKTTFPTGTGMEDVRTYDAAGDLADVTMKKGGTTQASIAYDHDPRGLISQAVQTGLPGTARLGYAYTDLAELASENSDTYRHDSAGNLVAIAGSSPLTYDDAGQLLRGPVPPGSSSTAAEFAYDQRGSRTEARPVGGSATTYAYDQAERLKTFTPAGGTATTYRYDGGGLRVAKTTGTTTKRWTWDRSGTLPLMLGDDANSYVYGPGGLPIAHITSTGTVRYYHHDALGSTRVLSDARGTTTATYTYTPYGTLAARTGTETTPLGYAGEQTDPESGLQYLRARHYDPATGQFLTRDPLVDQTGQPYAYADGDPINNTDPSGLFSIPIVGGDWEFDPSWTDFRNSWVNIGRGASFGLSDKIVDHFNPGASCTVPHNKWQEALGASASTVALGAGATWAAARTTRTAQGFRFAGNTRTYQLEMHGPHHTFGGRALSHVQLNWWQPGVKGSGGVRRLPLGRFW